jgi:two-component system NtrC family sensor kinase
LSKTIPFRDKTKPGPLSQNFLIKRFNVYTRSLKTNIAVQLVVLFLLAMILTAFLMNIFMQKALIRSEISKGYALLSGIRLNHTQDSNSKDTIAPSDFQDDFTKMITEIGFSCILIMDEHQNRVFSGGKNCDIQGELEAVTRQTIRSGIKTTRFFGSTWWGVWKQGQDMIISAPLIREGRVVGGSSVALSLTGVYEILGRTQHILLIYILVNTVVFTFIGFYRLTRIAVRPLQRLVKRAEEYQDDNEMFFLSESEDNEFSKLSKALNRMLGHIAEDKEKLQDAVASLEKANFDLKQAQKDIIRAEKLASVGRLSAGIAHEIGNPIGIINGYLELLKGNDISNTDREEFLQRTEAELKRIDTIIRQLLDFSRPSREDVKTVSVHAIIEDSIGTSRFHPLMSDIDLDLRLIAENDGVIADPNQLRQVFLNLMINAADAILSSKDPSKGKISIVSDVQKNIRDDSTDDADVLRVDYIDNGIGIAEADLENIFDPFFTTKAYGKGTGLGLSVCFMIVEKMGGKIEASSQEGQGTTITVYLPLHSGEDVDNG